MRSSIGSVGTGVLVPVGVFLLVPAALAFLMIAAYGMVLWVPAVALHLLQSNRSGPSRPS